MVAALRLLVLLATVHVHVNAPSGIPTTLYQTVSLTDGWYWPVTTTFDTCWCQEGNDIWLYIYATTASGGYHTYDQYGNVIAVVYYQPEFESQLSAPLTHEIVEATIDPYGGYYEAADGCPLFSYGGLSLSEYRHWPGAPCAV